MARSLKENHHKTFSKESELVRAARQAYYKTHQSNYEYIGSQDLSSTFREMATSTNLMGTEVQEVWTGQRDLEAAHHTAKASPKDIQFFRIMPPTESPKIMGLRGIHSPEALQCWGGLSFCPWCGKEGQNDVQW